LRHHPRDVPGRRVAAVVCRQGRDRQRACLRLSLASRQSGPARLEVVVADITTLRVDAIVNAANTSLLGGGGVDGAIHRAAGPRLLDECRSLGGCETGGAKITSGYGLPARHVIHAVGPVWNDGRSGEDVALASCYARAIELCRLHDLASVAFPAISTGVYRFPADRAARIAVAATMNALQSAPAISHVIFCCFSNDSATLHAQVLAECGGPCSD
jgi:O-acetyl-ADP-ribose deacetylase